MNKPILPLIMIFFLIWLVNQLWVANSQQDNPIIISVYTSHYGKIPSGECRVDESLAKYKGWRVLYNGRVYKITGITGYNFYYPNQVIFSGVGKPSKEPVPVAIYK